LVFPGEIGRSHSAHCVGLRVAALIALTVVPGVYASESDIVIPSLDTVRFAGLGGVSGATLMYLGLLICLIGAVFGVVQYAQTKALPVHKSMADVSNTIWETCKTYLFTQGKFLAR
jgi:K(+)-stimulated pyrophosphate-energized sodium pump